MALHDKHHRYNGDTLLLLSCATVCIGGQTTMGTLYTEIIRTITSHMYRFAVCLLFAVTSGVEATTTSQDASLVYVNYYQDAACTGNAFQTIIAPLNTCSCNSQTAGTTCNGYMKITESDPDLTGTMEYTSRLYSDNSCQTSTASISLGAGECTLSRLRVTTNEIASLTSDSVLECAPDSCYDREVGTNSASTVSSIASVGLLALIANVMMMAAPAEF